MFDGRTRAIAYLMRSAGLLDADVDAQADMYFRQCSIVVTAKDLAIMAATLANAGVNPTTGEQVIPRHVVAPVLTVMSTCGMYDHAGEWLYRVGRPAKSGVSGAISACDPAGACSTSAGAPGLMSPPAHWWWAWPSSSWPTAPSWRSSSRGRSAHGRRRGPWATRSRASQTLTQHLSGARPSWTHDRVPPGSSLWIPRSATCSPRADSRPAAGRSGRRGRAGPGDRPEPLPAPAHLDHRARHAGGNLRATRACRASAWGLPSPANEVHTIDLFMR